jgi:hypothetical protein
VTFRNSQKEIKSYNQKRVYPHEIAEEITKCLGKKNGKLFNLNKAYDLFVGVVISKIFDGDQVAEHEKLSIENITNLFQEITQHQNKEVVQPRLLKLEHI